MNIILSLTQFAICAMKVKNRPTVNEVLGGEEALRKKLKQLEKENGQLRDRLSGVRTYTHSLSSSESLSLSPDSSQSLH